MPNDVEEARRGGRRPSRRSTPKTSSKGKISLAKYKPGVAKSTMFLASPSSIYAAICSYSSLIDALHGSPDGGSSHDCNEESLLDIIHIHFGGCNVFCKTFHAALSVSDTDAPLAAATIEEAFHKSVRHLCDDECFLRAFRPIREFCFLWRDVVINDSTTSEDGSPKGGRVTKRDVLDGWSCKLLPSSKQEERNSSDSGDEANDGTAGRKRIGKKQPPPVVYVSRDGKEFATKSEAVKCMNDELPSLPIKKRSWQSASTATTPFIDAAAKINAMHSPLGLLEELFLHDPWKLLVSTICLNVTTRPQVDRILHQFLQRWPDAETTANADWEEIYAVIHTLGLGTKRALGLVRFSQEWLDLLEEGADPFALSEKQVKGLYNVGIYGWTAYEVFILRRLPSGTGGVKVCDHALQLYTEYRLGKKALEGREQSDLSEDFEVVGE